MSHSIIMLKVSQTETSTSALSKPQGRFDGFITWLRVLCCTCPACCLPPKHQLDHRARFMYYHNARFTYYGV